MDHLDPSAWIPLSKIKDINKDLYIQLLNH